MARCEQSVTFGVPIEQVWPVVADPAQVGACLAFVGETEVGAEVRWTIAAPMSAITATPYLTVRWESDPPREVRWKGEGRYLRSAGKIGLRTVREGTEVTVAMEMHVRGPLAPILGPLAAAQIEGQIGHFLEALGEQVAAARGAGEAAGGRDNGND